MSPSLIPTIPCPTPRNSELVRARASVVRADVQIGDAPPVDVSALEPLDVIFAVTAAQEASPELLAEAASEVPPGFGYALLERFLQLFCARYGRAFTLIY